VISHLYPYPGVDRHLFVHEQCLALRALGVEMRVISPTPWIPRVLWASSRMRRRGGKPPRAIRDGIVAEYPRFPQPPRRILFHRLGDLAYRRVRDLPAVTGEPYDLIHAHQALPDGAVAARLSRDIGVPYVVTVHGADVNRGLEGGGATARRIVEVLHGAAAVVAVSGVLARRLCALAALDDVHVVHNGVPTSLHDMPPAEYLPGRRIVMAAGRLVPRKGFEQVLEALAHLRDDHPDLRGVISGEGVLRRDLVALAARLGIADRVEFTGRLEHRDLLAMMARADVFALPSAPEGFGLVHLEAMAQTTPVIGCLDQGPADFIEDGVSGYLVPYGDAGALARAIAAALSDRSHTRALGESARRVAAGFTWEENARRMLEIYEKCGAARTDAA
jgi:glycosyltransferase involved in cell wall biosynthesis